MAEHLSFIRHVEWSDQQPDAQGSSVRPRHTMITLLGPRARHFPMPTPLSKVYLLSNAYLRTQWTIHSPELASRQSIDREIWLLGNLWAQYIVESVEFMALRTRLGGLVEAKTGPVLAPKVHWEEKKTGKPLRSDPNSMKLKRHLFRRMVHKVSQTFDGLVETIGRGKDMVFKAWLRLTERLMAMHPILPCCQISSNKKRDGVSESPRRLTWTMVHAFTESLGIGYW